MTLYEALKQDASLYRGHDFSYFDGKIRRRGQIEGIQVTDEEVHFKRCGVCQVLPSQHLRVVRNPEDILVFSADTRVSKFGDVLAFFGGRKKVNISPHKEPALVSQG